MTDEILTMFAPQFTALARGRLARATDVVERRDYATLPKMVRELHAIVGESCLLGITPLIALARTTENLAKRLLATHADADADALLAAIRELASTLDSVQTTPGGGGAE
jgi:chemotaxis protein histidine kinase CheA